MTTPSAASNTTSNATSQAAAIAVVDAYGPRARFARAETGGVRCPRLLQGLLDTATHIAEIPCASGHFLAEYARAGAAGTLVDASPAMLAAAVEHAAAVGLPADRTYATLAYLPTPHLPANLDQAVDQVVDLAGVDLVIAPNGAVNQVVRQMPLSVLLAGLGATMRAGAEVLAQVACTHPGGGVDTATFYEPTRDHDVWFADRWFDPAQAGGAVLRRRRQHRDGDQLRIEFDYHDPSGASLHTTTVELALFSPAQLAAAFTAAGFTHVRFLPGQRGLSEVLATAAGTR